MAYRNVTQSLHKSDKMHIAGDRSANGARDDARASLSSAGAASSPDTPFTGNENNDSLWCFSSTPPANLPLSRWTSVSNDDKLLTHLFSLFWTWEPTLTRILHREWLLHSLSTKPAEEGSVSSAPSIGRKAPFCSELLINSILAISMVCVSQQWECAFFGIRNLGNLGLLGLFL